MKHEYCIAVVHDMLRRGQSHLPGCICACYLNPNEDFCFKDTVWLV